MYAINKEEPTVKCIGCEIYFYSEDGMKTHFKNAHTNLNDASRRTNAPDTAESELPDIIPLTKTVTRGKNVIKMSVTQLSITKNAVQDPLLPVQY